MIEEEIAEGDVILIVVCVLDVGYFHHSWGLSQLAIVQGLVDVGWDQQSFCFLGMVADEVCDEEVADDCYDHDCVWSDCETHLSDGYHEDYKEGNDVEVDPEHSVCGLTVVVESTIWA